MSRERGILPPAGQEPGGMPPAMPKSTKKPRAKRSKKEE